jgi:IS605 OrfB family transposase
MKLLNFAYVDAAQNRAKGMLENYFKSRARGKRVSASVKRKKRKFLNYFKYVAKTRDIRAPYLQKDMLAVSRARDFKYNKEAGILSIKISAGEYHNIIVNDYVRNLLKDKEVRSFTLKPDSLAIAYRIEVTNMNEEPQGFIGIDRNMRNLTIAKDDHKTIMYFDMSKTIQIAENTTDIMRGFKRKDERIQEKLAHKYYKRQKNRVKHIVNKATKQIVDIASKSKSAIVLEKLTGIKKMYVRQKNQKKKTKDMKLLKSQKKMRKLSGYWTFGETKRQIRYKALAAGVKVIELSKSDTMGTSSLCYQCGKRTQDSKLKQQQRALYCENCKQFVDRDVNAAINIACRGRLRFDRSEGAASETVTRNPKHSTLVIRRVDAAKLHKKIGSRDLHL